MSLRKKLAATISETIMLSGNHLRDHAYPAEIDGIVDDVIELLHTQLWWRDMDSAPKERPILVWHYAKAEDYHKGPFSFHILDGVGSEDNQVYFAVWGGGDALYDARDEVSGESPDWWFERDSEFEQPLMPIKWMEIPRVIDRKW